MLWGAEATERSSLVSTELPSPAPPMWAAVPGLGGSRDDDSDDGEACGTVGEAPGTPGDCSRLGGGNCM